MTKYRKKPVIVDAAQVIHDAKPDGELWNLITEHKVQFRIDEGGFTVWTVDENEVLIPWEAYMVIDAKGFPYPCDREIFEAAHVRVRDDA